MRIGNNEVLRFVQGKRIRKRSADRRGRKAKQDLKNFGAAIYLPERFIGSKVYAIILTKKEVLKMGMLKWLRHEVEPQIKDKANDKRMTNIEELI